MSYTYFAAAAFSAALLVSPAAATTIKLVDNAFVETVSGSTIADFRYRLSNTNWDIGVAPAGDPINGFGLTNAGNVGQLSGNSYDFTLNHVAGTGFTFTMFGVNGADRIVSFTTADGERNGVNADDAFNAISIGPNARRSNDSQTAEVAVSNLQFTSAIGTLTIPAIASIAPQGLTETFLIADGNLALENWSLSGSVLASKSFFGGDELVKLDIKARSAIDNSPTPIPLPAAGWMLLAGVGALTALRRRKSA